MIGSITQGEIQKQKQNPKIKTKKDREQSTTFLLVAYWRCNVTADQTCRKYCTHELVLQAMQFTPPNCHV